MSQALAERNEAAIMEKVLLGGDLKGLNESQRVHHYLSVCESLGLNPTTRPFEYLTLNGKLQLYARKDASEQLRKIRDVSISEPTIRFEDEWIIVTVNARLPSGRTDSDIGVTSRKDMGGHFGNALMKAVTKSKRRVTLSICGLGMLDETEVETIPTAEVAQVSQDEPPVVLCLRAQLDTIKALSAELKLDLNSKDFVAKVNKICDSDIASFDRFGELSVQQADLVIDGMRRSIAAKKTNPGATKTDEKPNPDEPCTKAQRAEITKLVVALDWQIDHPDVIVDINYAADAQLENFGQLESLNRKQADDVIADLSERLESQRKTMAAWRVPAETTAAIHN